MDKKMKVPIGMRASWFYPIAAEPANAHPTYGPKVDMGAAVAGTMAITTATAEIFGDDTNLFDAEAFVSAQFDVETQLSDLQVNAALFGHDYSAGVELSGGDDIPAVGAYAFIEPLLRKDRKIVYRASFIFKTSVLGSSEKVEATTRQSNLESKTNKVSLKAKKDNAGKWRAREEFDTEAAAEAWLEGMGGTDAAYAVTFIAAGTAPALPSSNVFVAAGEDHVIDFGTTDPDALYDNGTDVTASITAHKYTVADIAANHQIVAIY